MIDPAVPAGCVRGRFLGIGVSLFWLVSSKKRPFRAKTAEYTTKQTEKKSKKGLAIMPAVSRIPRKCWF